ncbi:DUF4357 domain-containing protein [Bifidobacterium magnum]|uniref:Bacteriophage T5 Orf172 DNA-binding domain-containing protein n=1 Tax=Bifidobacterium magnum TaxID=1692 RepID=A0A087B998_9BIFI|nr:DUF4357 domain-containing protein [Bifidobacterium magnum]KFI67598.1 hypothetical protein BMAGN_0799 [Bifidobacterium magnum]
MGAGIIYVMSTAVDGLIKIGKTETGNYRERMRFLESNGYRNVAGLHREFAIKVEDYDEKERLLHEIFAKSRVGGSELFALDVDLAKQLLSAFEGSQVYPEPSRESKEEVFIRAAAEHRNRMDVLRIPDGTYHLDYQARGADQPPHVEMRVDNGTLTIPAGQMVSVAETPDLSEKLRELRAHHLDDDGRLIDDVCFDSPSAAARFARGCSSNGWTIWKTQGGETINIFRIS